jgi:putative flippase GtrA
MSDLLRRITSATKDYSSLICNIDFSLRRNRFMRFLVTGVVNTLFGFAVYSVAIISGITVWLSLLAGTVAGTVFNFFTTGGYVFRDISFNRFYRFIICYVLLYAFNLILIEGLSLWLTNKILTQFILTFPIAILSYLLMANFVFLKK